MPVTITLCDALVTTEGTVKRFKKIRSFQSSSACNCESVDIDPLMSGCTRILVTHNIHWMDDSFLFLQRNSSLMNSHHRRLWRKLIFLFLLGLFTLFLFFFTAVFGIFAFLDHYLCLLTQTHKIHQHQVPMCTDFNGFSSVSVILVVFIGASVGW